MAKDYSEIIIKNEPDDQLFNRLINMLKLEFKAEIIDDLIGLDIRYCDFNIGDMVLTLHQETFIGITLFPKALEDATEAGNILAEQIGYKLKYAITDNKI